MISKGHKRFGAVILRYAFFSTCSTKIGEFYIKGNET
jgi:hypothetical protein